MNAVDWSRCSECGSRNPEWLHVTSGNTYCYECASVVISFALDATPDDRAEAERDDSGAWIPDE